MTGGVTEMLPRAVAFSSGFTFKRATVDGIPCNQQLACSCKADDGYARLSTWRIYVRVHEIRHDLKVVFYPS